MWFAKDSTVASALLPSRAGDEDDSEHDEHGAC